jgi:hypothetical protein
MRTIVLQPWTTIAFDTYFVQGAEGWLDLGEYSDGTFWVDVASSSGAMAALTIETSPSWDEAYFQPIGQPLVLAVGTQLYKSIRLPATAPIARWVRWRLDAIGSATISLRVRVSPARQSFFTPPQIDGCQLWLRADLGATASGGTIEEWDDQSETLDPNQNLFAYSGPPQYNSSDAAFNGWPSISNIGLGTAANFVSGGAWANPLMQPCTWVVVLEPGENYDTQCLFDSNDLVTGQSIEYDFVAENVWIYANGGSVSAPTVGGTTAILGEWNGSNSNIYLNDFTTPAASGTVGGGVAGSQGSMTLFSGSQAGGGGYNFDGSVAEIIAYRGILGPGAKGQLRTYFNIRYNLSIT